MGQQRKIGFIKILKGVFRFFAYIGENGTMPKPGEAPICEQIKAENLRAHQELREYIADVDTRNANTIAAAEGRSTEATKLLRNDMNSRLDQMISILKPKG